MKKQEEAWLLSEKYSGEKTEGFFTDCERLAAGEPLGYIIGFVPFLDCKIWLDSKPLIPRSETEYWTERAIGVIKSAGAKPPRILDLCAGSGAVGVAVAKAVGEAHVTFGEIDKAHLATIGKNLKENHIDCTRYQVFQSDLFDGLPKSSSDTQKTVVLDEMRGTGEFSKKTYRAYGDEKIGTRNEADRQNDSFLFDFILTNPPYINKEAHTVEESVELHEPHLALFGGKDGMECIEKIIAGARAKLAPHGQLWIEHEPEQSSAIQTLATQHGFSATTHKDQYDVERYSVLGISQN